MSPTIQVKDSENGRIYLINNKEYCSVTTPLQILSSNYLEIWRAKKGKKVADEIAKRAAAHGSTIHSYVDKICNGQEPEIANKFAKQMDAFKAWFSENVVKVWEVEKVVWSNKYMVAGRYDFLGELKGHDGLILVDWKTGRVKKEHFLQLAAYRHLTAECVKKIKLSDIKKRLILNIREDKITEVWPDKTSGTDKNIEEDWDVYLSLLTVHNWLKRRKGE